MDDPTGLFSIAKGIDCSIGEIMCRNSPKEMPPGMRISGGLFNVGQQPGLFFEQVVIFEDRLTVLLSVVD